MAKILIAKKDDNRWNVDTVIDAFSDSDNLNSFPESLYCIINCVGSVEEVRNKFQERAGIVVDLSSGKSCDNNYRKNLSVETLIQSDIDILENPDSLQDGVDSVFLKFVKIDSIPVDPDLGAKDE